MKAFLVALFLISTCTLQTVCAQIGVANFRNGEVEITEFDYFSQQNEFADSLNKTYPLRTKLKFKKKARKNQLNQLQSKEWMRFWSDFSLNTNYDISQIVPFGVYHKFYIDESGKIVHFLYRTKKKFRENEAFEIYQKQLLSYAQNFQFDIELGKKWSQSGYWTHKRYRNRNKRRG